MNLAMPPVSRRMQDVQMPVIPWVGDLIRRTPGTISLGQGVVDYAPPAAAHEALVRFCADPALHKYQHEQGIPHFASGSRPGSRQRTASTPAGSP